MHVRMDADLCMYVPVYVSVFVFELTIAHQKVVPVIGFAANLPQGERLHVRKLACHALGDSYI